MCWGGGLGETRLVAQLGFSAPAPANRPHAARRGVRLYAPGSGGISSQLQLPLPRPRQAAYHLEVNPLSWRGLGGTRGHLPVTASQGEKLDHKSVALRALRTASSAGRVCTQVLSVWGRTQATSQSCL